MIHSFQLFLRFIVLYLSQYLKLVIELYVIYILYYLFKLCFKYRYIQYKHGNLKKYV